MGMPLFNLRQEEAFCTAPYSPTHHHSLIAAVQTNKQTTTITKNKTKQVDGNQIFQYVSH